MIRFATLFWICVVVAAALALYRVKYEVQSLQGQIVQTEKQLKAERTSLRVVVAEWAYLNRPERLQALSAKYLGASPLTVQQVAVVGAIPMQSLPLAGADTPLAPVRSVSVGDGE